MNVENTEDEVRTRFLEKEETGVTIIYGKYF